MLIDKDCMKYQFFSEISTAIFFFIRFENSFVLTSISVCVWMFTCSQLYWSLCGISLLICPRTNDAVKRVGCLFVDSFSFSLSFLCFFFFFLFSSTDTNNLHSNYYLAVLMEAAQANNQKHGFPIRILLFACVQYLGYCCYNRYSLELFNERPSISRIKHFNMI